VNLEQGSASGSWHHKQGAAQPRVAADRAIAREIGGQTRIVVSSVAKVLTPNPRGG